MSKPESEVPLLPRNSFPVGKLQPHWKWSRAATPPRNLPRKGITCRLPCASTVSTWDTCGMWAYYLVFHKRVTPQWARNQLHIWLLDFAPTSGNLLQSKSRIAPLAGIIANSRKFKPIPLFSGQGTLNGFIATGMAYVSKTTDDSLHKVVALFTRSGQINYALDIAHWKGKARSSWSVLPNLLGRNSARW